ncbi:hypothetical protein AOQ84DRAFT_369512 [Glonium stellatum]|uniref:Uncharacterized protein n=1 Tax=Glonium stellatum TaxID=574774 RepID=A0A8E2JLZ8_9PEZI|nr:hypothetical protein AOQ84DRAFT_369512 [Glonium stellatum]
MSHHSVTDIQHRLKKPQTWTQDAHTQHPTPPAHPSSLPTSSTHMENLRRLPKSPPHSQRRAIHQTMHIRLPNKPPRLAPSPQHKQHRAPKQQHHRITHARLDMAQPQVGGEVGFAGGVGVRALLHARAVRDEQEAQDCHCGFASWVRLQLAGVGGPGLPQGVFARERGVAEGWVWGVVDVDVVGLDGGRDRRDVV